MSVWLAFWILFIVGILNFIYLDFYSWSICSLDMAGNFCEKGNGKKLYMIVSLNFYNIVYGHFTDLLYCFFQGWWKNEDMLESVFGSMFRRACWCHHQIIWTCFWLLSSNLSCCQSVICVILVTFCSFVKIFCTII